MSHPEIPILKVLLVSTTRQYLISYAVFCECQCFAHEGVLLREDGAVGGPLGHNWGREVRPALLQMPKDHRCQRVATPQPNNRL
eukprot:6629253-Pyramimonas_sp.AAC.1